MQADLQLCWLHMALAGFLMTRLIQYSLQESSNFQLSCVNISFFPRNKASKLAWILRVTRGDRPGIFVQVAGNFLKKLEDGQA